MPGANFSNCDPRQLYHRKRLEAAAEAFTKNGFDAHVCADLAEAATYVRETVVPALNPRVVSWGGSVTLAESGLVDYFLACHDRGELEVISTFASGVPREELIERRRLALLSDLFLTGANAMTESGQIVNLDMVGNRVAAMCFGPRKVVLLAGRNKLVGDVEAATTRIKELAAPMNTMRLNKKTPCAKTGFCMDCSSPDRICNVWAITEKSFPKGRITLLLINQDLGF